MSYADDLVTTLNTMHETRATALRGRGTDSVQLKELIATLGEILQQGGRSVYVEVDRATLHPFITQFDEGKGPQGVDLIVSTTYMFPTAVRIDADGDVIIHATDGELATS